MQRLFVVDVRAPSAAAARDQFAIRTAIASDPGVEAVSWGSPIGPPFTERMRHADGLPGREVTLDVRPVGPAFLRTMRIPIVAGRDFVDADLGTDPRPVIVNEAFVRRHLASTGALGARFTRSRNPDSGRPLQTLEIVGIAQDTLARTAGEGRVPVMYVPDVARSFTVRVRQDDGRTASGLRERVRGLEPAGSAVAVNRFADTLDAALQPMRTATRVLGMLAGIGLVLATTGLFAVVKYVVTQRRPEIGVRLALGASRGRIISFVLRDGLRVLFVGWAGGLAVSLIASRAIARLLPDQVVVTPVTILAVTVLLFAAALAATLVPALRASATDPVTVLRYE
jgi:hypothetical protein